MTVTISPAADLRGATFDLPGVQDGVSGEFVATADGTSGILTVAASEASEAAERPRTVQGRSGVDSSKAWTGALRVTTTASLTAKTRFVDAKNGKDSNDGSQRKPFKTLKKGLSLAKSGDTVKLLPGSYTNTGSGDTYPLTVPSGVTIAGTRASNGAQQTFLSPVSSAAQETGLVFAGDATVKDVELDVFGIALFADKGKQTLSTLNLGGNRTSLQLRGTAQTTVKNSKFFINAKPGIIAVNIDQQARFTMDGGTIETGSQNCETGVRGIAATGVAQVTLKSSLLIKDIAGGSLELLGSSKGILQNVRTSRTLPDDCQPQPMISSFGTSLTISGGLITNRGGVQGTSIAAGGGGSGSLILNGADLDGDLGGTSTGISLNQVQLTMTNSSIAFYSIGINARFNSRSVVITDSRFNFNDKAIRTTTGLKLRNSTFTLNRRSIEFDGVSVSGDLGTNTDPGGNTILNGSTSDQDRIIGVNLFDANAGLVSAVGNTWTAATQQSDINGHYPSKLEVGPTSKQFENKKKNFFLPNTNTKIQF